MRTGELLDDQYGAEDLLLGDTHVVVNVGEDGGRDEVALVPHLVSARHQFRALLLPLLLPTRQCRVVVRAVLRVVSRVVSAASRCSVP
jgi:hypothetical protein